MISLETLLDLGKAAWMFSDTDKDSHKCGGNDSVNGLPFYYDPSDFHVDKLNVAITLVRRRIGSDVAIFSLYDSRRPQTVSYRVGEHTPLLEMMNLPFIVARLLTLAESNSRNYGTRGKPRWHHDLATQTSSTS
jgi:hypothetical protein